MVECNLPIKRALFIPQVRTRNLRIHSLPTASFDHLAFYITAAILAVDTQANEKLHALTLSSKPSWHMLVMAGPILLGLVLKYLGPM